MKQRMTLKLLVFVVGIFVWSHVDLRRPASENSLENEKKISGKISEQYFAANSIYWRVRESIIGLWAIWVKQGSVHGAAFVERVGSQLLDGALCGGL